MDKKDDINVIGMTKKDFLIETILGDLASGILKIGDRLPGERILGETYGMSRMTVRQSIQHLINEGILSRTQGKGTYIINSPDSLKNSDVENVSNNVFVFLPGTTFFTNGEQNLAVKRGVLEAVHDKMAPLGFQISIKYFYTTDGLSKSINDCVARDKAAKFVIWYVESPKNKQTLKKLNKEHVDYVLVDSYQSDVLCDYAVTENVNGGYAGIEHLYKQGHQKIAFVSFDIKNSSIRDREKGVLEAYKKFGLKDGAIIRAPFQCKDKELIAIAEEIIKGGFSAFFVFTDDMAIKLMRYLMEKGYQVPGDIAVVGYDDIDMSKYIIPSLTSVAQDFYKMGECAAEIIIEKLNGVSSDEVKHIQIKPYLKERGSSKVIDEGVETNNTKRRSIA